MQKRCEKAHDSSWIHIKKDDAMLQKMDLRIVLKALWHFKLSHYKCSDLTFCLVSLGTVPWNCRRTVRSSLVRLSCGAQFPKQTVFSIGIILSVIFKNCNVLDQLFHLVWMVEVQKIKLLFSLWRLFVQSPIYFEMYINNKIRPDSLQIWH